MAIKTALSDRTGASTNGAIQAINSFAKDTGKLISSLSSRRPNPLRDHNHCNYIITLGILGVTEINNPATYRSSGFQKIILRSGGGEYNVRQRVFLEGGENAEYFIENIDVDALIAPNEKTGISLGTTVNFQVIEPYSMGKFIESMIAAAGSLGYNSFNNAPYCLKIEFNGWDEYGENNASYVSPPYFLPILITQVDFNLNEGGSVYQVQAVPYSEISLSNEIDNTHVDIKVSGKFVHQILENGELSVTNTINKSMFAIEETTNVSNYDRYMILFPKTATTIAEALGSGVITREGQKAVGGISAAEFDNPKLREYFNNRISTKVNTEIYQVLKSLAVDTSKMNKLGNSEVENQMGTESFKLPQDIYDDAIIRTAKRNIEASAYKEFTWPQSTRITSIIESVLQSSKEVRQEATTDQKEKSPSMYRIETYTFVVDNVEIEKIIGRQPRIYVYAVHPYISDQAHYLAPNRRPSTTTELMKSAIKEYNYFYTGKNEDILDFDIKFNYGFLQAAFSDYGQLTAVERIKTQSSVVASDQTLNVTPPTAANATQTQSNGVLGRSPTLDTRRPGFQFNDATAQLAAMMHNIFINSNVDLITAEMKIWGDPYFLPTILGNYSPTQISETLTSDLSINYLKNDVMVIINFRNPLDYEISGELMTFNDEINPSFSGVYQVIGVTSQFQKGVFTQDIKMIRQRGQEIETSTTNEKILVSSTDKASLNKPQPTGSRDVTDTRPPSPDAARISAAQVTALGTIVDNRVGVWANEATKAAATGAGIIANTLVNPFASLSKVGKALVGNPPTITPSNPSDKKNRTLNVKSNPPSGPQ